MNFVDTALAHHPEAKADALVVFTYQRLNFNPKVHKSQPLRAKYALGYAAYLLKMDAGYTDEQISEKLDCSLELVAKYLEHAERCLQSSEQALLLVSQVRDAANDQLEFLGAHTFLEDAIEAPPKPVPTPIPNSIIGIRAYIAKWLRLSIPSLIERTRKVPETDARQLTMAFCKAVKRSRRDGEIADHFDRDESATRVAVARVSRVVNGEEDDPDFLRKIEMVCEKFGFDLKRLIVVQKK